MSDERLKERFRALLATQLTAYGQYTILSADPPIFYAMYQFEPPGKFVATYRTLFEHLRGRKAFCLLCHVWALSPYLYDVATEMEALCTREFPDVEILHLCNEPGQAEIFRERGARAVFCNHNSFVDENMFRPMPDIKRRFDAVYNARLVAWKRHVLTEQIARLALLHYPNAGDDPAEAMEIRRRLSRAHFFNEPDGAAYRSLSPQAVGACLNECSVGLCLSEEEGAMYTSMEYLLCGLPVVTTPSRGGRHVFFDERFVATVPPDATAVRAAVDQLRQGAPPAEFIRAETLAKVQVHRNTFVALVQSIYDEHGVPRRFAEEWRSLFFHRMLRRSIHAVTIATLEAARAGK